jgi:hypothetical protein
MFSPPTENFSFNGIPEIGKLLSDHKTDIARIQANTDSERRKVKDDLKALLNPQGSLSQASTEAFRRDVTEHLYIINAEHDEVMDVGPNEEKIVSEEVRKLSELPTIGPPRLVTLRYTDIGGTEEDARAKKSGVKNPAYAHGIVVKMGEQRDFSFFDRFEELLFARIGVPPRSLSADVEQIRQSTFDRINATIFEMNRFVVDRNPMVGLCWRNIADAVKAKVGNLPGSQQQKETEDLVRQIYYVYIVLDQYAQLDDLRNRGYMSADDPKIIEWKRSTLPNLMGSDVGKWMLGNNLTEYYSEQMNKDLRQAVATTPPSDAESANNANTTQNH